MRTFAALDLDDDVRDAVADEIGHLRSHFPKIRWTRPENLHVTVQFLGEVRDGELADICAALDESATAIDAFSLECRGTGCFPDASRPRVLWAGCGAGSTDAERFAHVVATALASLGFDRDRRRYTPHVTMGRVKNPAHARGLAEILADPQELLFGWTDVSDIVLYRSELGRGGPTYTPLHRAPLR